MILLFIRVTNIILKCAIPTAPPLPSFINSIQVSIIQTPKYKNQSGSFMESNRHTGRRTAIIARFSNFGGLE